jgi:hypothetical protein
MGRKKVLVRCLGLKCMQVTVLLRKEKVALLDMSSFTGCP